MELSTFGERSLYEDTKVAVRQGDKVLFGDTVHAGEQISIPLKTGKFIVSVSEPIWLNLIGDFYYPMEMMKAMGNWFQVDESVQESRICRGRHGERAEVGG